MKNDKASQADSRQSEFEKNAPHDEKSVKAVADVKVASVMHRDRSMLAVASGLLCASYVALYRLSSSFGWAILAVVAGVAMVWFAITSAAAKKSVKTAVLSLDDAGGQAKARKAR